MAPAAPSSSDVAVTRAAHGAIFAFMGGTLQKVFTTALRFFVYRRLTSAEVGFSENEMEKLLLATVLFVSREPTRLVAMRAPLDVLSGGASSARAQLANVAWLPVPLGLLGAAAAYSYAANATSTRVASGSALEGEALAVALYCGAIAVEILAEPAFIFSHALMLAAPRATIETLAALVKCVTVYGLVVRAGVIAAPAIAAGQLAGALVVFFGLWGVVLRAACASRTTHALRGLLPSPVPRDADRPRRGSACASFFVTQFGEQAAAIFAPFFMQNFVKHMLTEGDAFALSYYATRGEAGDYNIAQSYGSLAPRILFAPVEDALRSLVSKLVRTEGAPMSRADTGASAASLQHSGDGRARRAARGESRSRLVSAQLSGADADDAGSALSPKEAGAVLVRARSRVRAHAATPPPTKPSAALTAAAADATDVLFATRIFCAALRALLLVSLLFAGFVSAYAPLVARVALPNKPAVGDVLAAYALLVPFLAMNGATEAFAMGAADAARLLVASAHLTVGVVVGVTVAALLTPAFGVARALIAANAAVMALRSASSLRFVGALLDARGVGAGALADAIPRVPTLLCIAAATAAAHGAVRSGGGEDGVLLKQLAVGAALGAVAAGVVAALEGRRLVDGLRALRRR